MYPTVYRTIHAVVLATKIEEPSETRSLRPVWKTQLYLGCKMKERKRERESTKRLTQRPHGL